MKNRSVFTIICLFISSALFSQAPMNVKVTVKGQVIDSLTSETIPYATLRLSDQATPNVILKAFATDDNGKFQFSIEEVGNYLLNVYFIGKAPYFKTLEIKADGKIDLGKLLMKENENQLGEVVISAQKPLVKVDLDKISYSIEDDPESKTNNVLDMLRKVPLVTIDGEENIQLKGSSNFKIYLNGKPSNMISNNPKEVLKGMPANTIKDIEVITDPGAKYDAEGVAGIINIITQKNTSMGGYTGTVSGRGDSNGGFGGGLYMMMKYGKVGFTGNYNYYNHRRPEGEYNSFRETKDNGYLVTQNGTSKSRGNGQYGYGELSYEMDSLNLINVSFNRHYGKGKNYSDWFVRNQTATLSEYKQTGSSENTYGGTDVGVDYQRTFANKKDRLLTVSYKYSLNPNDAESNTDVEYLIPAGTPSSFTRLTTDAEIAEHTGQIDFVTPFSKMHSIEAGVKYIARNNKSDNDRFVNDNLISSEYDNFRHKNSILGAYTGYSLKKGKWGAKTGLRLETTLLKAEFLDDRSKDFDADYTNLVPSATMTYQLKPMQNIRLGYNMRISRPGIRQLNPFTNNSDPNYISVGNPNLDVAKSHSINLNYGFFNPKFNLNINTSYNFENNGIENITYLNADNVSVSTYDNIGKRKQFNISGYVSWSPSMKLRIFSNLSGSYTDLKANTDDNNLKQLSNSGFSGQMFGGIQYNLPKSFTIYGNAGFFSQGVSLMGSGTTFHFHSFSLRKSMIDQRLNISVYADSPFTKDFKFKNKQDTFEYRSEMENTFRRRQFGISLSYRFGELKAQIKKAQRSIKNDDVMSSGGDSQNAGGSGQGGGQ